MAGDTYWTPSPSRSLTGTSTRCSANGTGKSSLVRALLGAQKPQQGSVTVFGRSAWKERVAVMSQVGFVPEEAEAEKEMSVGQLVDFQRRLFPRWDDRIVARRFDRLRIARSRRFSTLSKGRRARCSSPHEDQQVRRVASASVKSTWRTSPFEEASRPARARGAEAVEAASDESGRAITRKCRRWKSTS